MEDGRDLGGRPCEMENDSPNVRWITATKKTAAPTFFVRSPSPWFLCVRVSSLAGTEGGSGGAKERLLAQNRHQSTPFGDHTMRCLSAEGQLIGEARRGDRIHVCLALENGWTGWKDRKIAESVGDGGMEESKIGGASWRTGGTSEDGLARWRMIRLTLGG